MSRSTIHQCQVFGSPWAGVYATLTHSARHYGRHWHAVYGLGLLEDGAQSSASARGKVQAFAGDLIASNPGEVHDGQPLGGPTRRWRMVYLEPAVMASMADDAPSTPSGTVELARPVIQDARLSQALQGLLRRLGAWDARRQSASADALACEESLVQTCALLLQGHASAASRVAFSAEVNQVRERLADDLLEPPNLTEMAAMTGLSKYQVLRRFEQAYGVTPHAWLLQQRAERARRLILSGADLAQAAASSGFADQSHMTRIFARHFGFTPGAWKQSAASGGRP
ncbi:helix-turn-helix domain-containing protein [Rhodoferax sp.]|uniref:AraC family transcriptional regulator n=1 Tax=Rhodoferax sp. TaxID=50421 RepID=UPI00275CEF80|nr:AraC family transcriptional regulator [Rhodoferax sp.]